MSAHGTFGTMVILGCDCSTCEGARDEFAIHPDPFNCWVGPWRLGRTTLRGPESERIWVRQAVVNGGRYQHVGPRVTSSRPCEWEETAHRLADVLQRVIEDPADITGDILNRSSYAMHRYHGLRSRQVAP